MQILGKRSKILVIAVAIVMLVVVGVSFAVWDISAVKATSGDLSEYANAKVGDVITFGNYYQTGKRVNNDENAEYEKTPIEWLVVDKDERTGQLTLMSKYILAAGSYFGNWYYNNANSYDDNYMDQSPELSECPYNQAYVESTARAFLNNLERRDLGGDFYSPNDGYKTSVVASTKDSGLLISVGFSNSIYTFIKDKETNEFKRPIANDEYRNRPATRGFYDEAFSAEEKALIMPKNIPGYTGYRWTNNYNATSERVNVGGAVDKVWLPSATELNIMATNDSYINPSDGSSATVFEYFKSYNQYQNPVSGKINSSLADALKSKRTDFVASDSKAMSYSIPVYEYQSTVVNDDINAKSNSTDIYWTRSPRSSDYKSMYTVDNFGLFDVFNTNGSRYGVRPCIILKY